MPSNAANISLQSLADATARNIIVVNTDGIAVLLSRMASENLNIQIGDLLEAEVPGFWAQVDKVLCGSLSHCEIPLQIAGNEYLVGVNPLLDNHKITGAVCVLINSDQLDTMTRRLPSFHTLTRELDTIIDSSSDGLFVCDANANVIRVNPASEKIHGMSAQELIGRNMRELIEDGFIDQSAALKTSQTKKPASLLQDKNGRMLISIATPVFDDQEQLVRVVVSERDITEIESLQRELEAQQALKNGLRDQMLAMQQAELEAQQIIARSPAMIRALGQAIKVSKVESSVLILGESGVGKGLIADMIHKNSIRAEQPLIKINCGAIPESLIEAELFGYEKGAFTGAQATGKPGQFELADGGTLFLDEIAELPLSSQVKLLRFLEDGQITRLGDTRSRTVNVRVLAATHQNLEQLVDKGLFRLDLYYRLNVIPIQIPALRERHDCIVPLIHHYVNQLGSQVGKEKRLTRAALDTLTAYPYPGNVRELMNLCERMVVMSDTEIIDVTDLPSQVTAYISDNQPTLEELPIDQPLQQTLDRVERRVLALALKRYTNQTQMAEALGVNQSTIARKLQRHGLR